MKIKVTTIIGVFAIGLLFSACSYKSSGTSTLTQIDGTKVDYANMSKYKKFKSCRDFRSREDSSLSVFDGAKAAGITKVVYVDRSHDANQLCIIVYGE